jgi:hypothetical protein
LKQFIFLWLVDCRLAVDNFIEGAYAFASFVVDEGRRSG